ncbi:MAG: hypothetical protein LBD20_10150 [Spirochaetaceae bacterium]|jgi:hypothetical protein|nr:hypothetical protein [Spirochaetaceae bacterium]
MGRSGAAFTRAGVISALCAETTLWMKIAYAIFCVWAKAERPFIEIHPPLPVIFITPQHGTPVEGNRALRDFLRLFA